MKKLMILAVVAVAAVASQAADIKWGARNIYIPVASDVTKDQSGIVPTTGAKFDASALAVSLFWVEADGTTKNSLGTLTTTGSGLIGAKVLGNTSTDTALYEAMLAEGGTYKPTYYFEATYTTADGVYTYAGTAQATSAINTLPSSAITVTADFTKTGSWTYTANPVPEPTSGLLLLLGVAGFALRRRRA